jgi:hypothetical protein
MYAILRNISSYFWVEIDLEPKDSFFEDGPSIRYCGQILPGGIFLKREINNWLNANMQNRYKLIANNAMKLAVGLFLVPYTSIKFKYKEDAILFKLTWC